MKFGVAVIRFSLILASCPLIEKMKVVKCSTTRQRVAEKSYLRHQAAIASSDQDLWHHTTIVQIHVLQIEFQQHQLAFSIWEIEI